MRCNNYLAFRNTFDLIVRNEQLYSTTCINRVDHPRSVGGGRMQCVHLLLCVSRLLRRPLCVLRCARTPTCRENTQHTKRGPRWWLFLSFIDAVGRPRDTIDCTSCRASRLEQKGEKMFEKKASLLGLCWRSILLTSFTDPFFHLLTDVLIYIRHDTKTSHIVEKKKSGCLSPSHHTIN